MTVSLPPTTPWVPPAAPVEFPASLTEAPATNWRRRTVTAAGVAIALALVAGVGVARASGSSTAGFRTATVSTHDVASTLTGVGSIEPASQVTVTFPVSGTVATVDVSVGQAVGTGQQLASLDPQSLTTALNQKQSALAAAELTLSKALSGSGAAPSTGGAGTTTAGNSGGSGGTTAVSDAQHGVVQAQQAVDHSLVAADQALATAQQACSAPAPAPPTTSTTSPSGPTTSTTLPAPGGGTDACATAQQAVATAQAQVASDQKALSAAVATLVTAVAQQTPAGATSRPTTGTTSANSSTAARTTAGGAGTSAADLVADQKAVDAAAAEVALAQQNLAATTVVSPISGTVAAVDLTVGESVSAGSTTAHVIVVGQGGMEVTTPVSVDQIPHVEVGQRATVLPDGASTPLPGQVVAIGLAPTTSARSTTYTVTIGLDDQGSGLFNGSTATVAITTAGATSVLAVPTSAVQADGTAKTVTVLDGGTTRTVTVTTGVVGSQWTQITDGLTDGQVVVIADLSQPLPGSATATTNGQTTTAGRGAFPRVGGAGFGGARPNG